jgi:adenosylhomocysteine nucleosidase
MELRGAIDPTLPLLVVAVGLEAEELRTTLPVLITGVGKLASGQAVMETIAPLALEQRPSTLINLGTAGALIDEMTGTHLIGRVLQHDLDGLAIEALVGHNPSPEMILGNGPTLATGDSFISSHRDRQRLSQRAQLVDMEGYAVASAAKRLGIEVMLVKHVSDYANESAAGTWAQGVAACSHRLGTWLQEQNF